VSCAAQTGCASAGRQFLVSNDLVRTFIHALDKTNARLLAILTAPVFSVQNGETALICAAEAGHAAIVLMLLETKPGVHDTVSVQFQGPVAIPSDM
jgi:ankyrin repeat protein